MKKKICSLFLMLCLIFPSFFAAGCTKEVEKKDYSYTYSVTLKNAEGKIDANTLSNEYDVSKAENVTWKKSGADYTISVTKSTAVSGTMSVSLLEGYDYSNIDFKVNDETKDYQVVCGNETDCANKPYLTNRTFKYNYSNMQANTNVVLNFADCEIATITLDISDLKDNDVKYLEIEDDFVTLVETETYDYLEISNTTITAEYGTIFAFDYSEPLTFVDGTYSKDMSYSTYGSRYNVETNRIQYLAATRSGKCCVYDATEDNSNNGTVRLIGCSGVKLSTSQSMQLGTTYETAQSEKEWYDNEIVYASVYSKDGKGYFELNSEAQNYNYYLLDAIDEVCSLTNKITVLNDSVSGVYYFEYTFSANNPAQYIVRIAKESSNYFAVTIKSLPDGIQPYDYSYVRFGNNDSNLPMSNSDKIAYYYKNDTDVKFRISERYENLETGSTVSINEVEFTFDKFDKDGNKPAGSFAPMTFSNFANTNIAAFDVYDSTHNICLYEVKEIYCSTLSFSNSLITLNLSNLELYDGEEIYYAVGNPNSTWNKLTSASSLSISSRADSTIYYYFESNRIDADLNIFDADGEIISVTGKLRDCFGRKMTGTVDVSGTTINLSEICYLDVQAGTYSPFTTDLLREYDETSHNIDFASFKTAENYKNSIMISIAGYTDDGSTFSAISNYDELKISHTNSSVIYFYYSNQYIDKILMLKDGDGNVVSTVDVVRNLDKTAFKIDNKVVYALRLVGDYYDVGEEFILDEKDVTYSIKNSDSTTLNLYSEEARTNAVTSIKKGIAYYFVGDEDKFYRIYDKTGVNLMTTATATDTVVETGKKVFVFTFSYPDNYSFENGYEFILNGRYA